MSAAVSNLVISLGAMQRELVSPLFRGYGEAWKLTAAFLIAARVTSG